MSALSQTKLNVDQIRANDDTTTTEVSIPGLEPRFVKAYAGWNYIAGVPTVLSSYNVSSLTDVGLGHTAINLTAPMADNDWCAITSAQFSGVVGACFTQIVRTSSTASQIHSQHFQNGAAADPTNYHSLMVFNED